MKYFLRFIEFDDLEPMQQYFNSGNFVFFKNKQGIISCYSVEHNSYFTIEDVNEFYRVIFFTNYPYNELNKVKDYRFWIYLVNCNLDKIKSFTLSNYEVSLTIEDYPLRVDIEENWYEFKEYTYNEKDHDLITERIRKINLEEGNFSDIEEGYSCYYDYDDYKNYDNYVDCEEEFSLRGEDYGWCDSCSDGDCYSCSRVFDCLD